MRKILLFIFLLNVAVVAQTGSSISFGTSGTSSCDAPAANKTILCGTANSVTVSFNGASPITLPAKGNDGVAATITIGTVTSGATGTAPKVTNGGTANAAVLNFTIPSGAPGTNGTNGKDGATGAQGPPGPAGTASLTNANCSLKFTGATTTDGSVAVVITCQ
jgi:hypothetical protein